MNTEVHPLNRQLFLHINADPDAHPTVIQTAV